MKQKFFVAYDYGMGGAWAIVSAENEQQIKNKFPELEIHRERPAWMTNHIYDRLMEVSHFEIDDESTYPDWILSLIRGKKR